MHIETSTLRVLACSFGIVGVVFGAASAIRMLGEAMPERMHTSTTLMQISIAFGAGACSDLLICISRRDVCMCSSIASLSMRIAGGAPNTTPIMPKLQANILKVEISVCMFPSAVAIQ